MTAAPCYIRLAACSTLRTRAEVNTWYRAVRLPHLGTALSTAHTLDVSGRFHFGSATALSFPVLYLAENPMVALFEVRALLGSPTGSPGVVPSPTHPWAVINVAIDLQKIADLTDPRETAKLGTTTQELTGDWRGYDLRRGIGTVPEPTGLAPTQQLGAALYSVPELEGFLTPSAPLAYHRNLIVFPDKLQPASTVRWQDPTTGQWHDVDGAGPP